MDQVTPEPAKTSLEAYAERVTHWLDANQHERAEKECLRALGTYPDSSALHHLLAIALVEQDRFEEAEGEAREALALDAESPGVRRTLARIVAEDGRNQEAEKLLIEALRIAPEEPSLYFQYGVLLYQTGHLEKAEQALLQTLRFDPEFAPAHSLLATLRSEGNRMGEAFDSAKMGLRNAPEADFSHAMAGLTALRGGKPFQARKYLREALRLDPADQEVEELWLHADKCCRIPYLPYYYWSLLMDRLPGKQFAVWGVFVALMMMRRAFDIDSAAFNMIALGYVSFVIYTWVAEPLAALWIKIFPPR